MSVLYVDRKGMELRHDAGRIVLFENGSLSGAVPLAQLERVVVWRGAIVHTALLGALAEAGVGFAVIDPRRTERTAVLPGRGHGDAARRLAQYRMVSDWRWCFAWSRRLLSAKLRGQQKLLLRLAELNPKRRHALVKGSAVVGAQAAALDDARGDVDRLRGLEGAAAAAYFRALGAAFAPSLEFHGRNRRPPRDPVNATLSLGYTLAHTQAVITIHAAGFDPMLGFLHEPAHGRESLACDFVEPCRPLVDEWVWRCFRERILRKEQFHHRDGGCFLSKTGRRSFFAEHERNVGCLRHRLRALARMLARDVGIGDGGSDARADHDEVTLP